MALTTEASTVGNASLRVFSACCCGVNGRGGFGGGAGADSADCPGAAEDEVTPLSCGSSSPSKSRGRAVVGDSGLGLLSAAAALVGVAFEPS